MPFVHWWPLEQPGAGYQERALRNILLPLGQGKFSTLFYNLRSPNKIYKLCPRGLIGLIL